MLASLYVNDLAIYYSSTHMLSIEWNLQQSLNRLGRWCDENGFKFSPTKTMCVHFCQLWKLHLYPELYLNGTQIPIIGEAKFLYLLFDSKLSFIPHITLITFIQSFDWIKTWLWLYCVWFCKTSYIKRLDTVHNQSLRLCLGAFRTSCLMK